MVRIFYYIYTMTIDNALLRFKTSLNAAKELGDSKVANVFDWSFLCVSPVEEYLQISNFNTDVNFGGDYKAELVDCCDKVLKDITSNVFIYQGSNSESGYQNIAVEIAYIGDFYPNWGRKCYLKISHWAGGEPVSDLVIYSNPFHVAYNLKEVLRIDYRGYGMNNGVDYTNFNFMQSFGLKGFYSNLINNTQSEEYQQAPTQSGAVGVTISSEQNTSYARRFILLNATDYALTKLIGWCGSPRFYIEGTRYTSNQVVVGERQGNSNFYDGEIIGKPNELDIHQRGLQIAPLLSFSPIYPVGVYTLAGLLPTIQGQFNYPITLGVGNLYVRKVSDGSIVNTFTQSDIVVTDNSFEINQAAADENGEYYITFDESLFSFPFGQSEYVVDWEFSIADGDYDDDDYESDDYFTN